jgi:hypothetical protein
MANNFLFHITANREVCYGSYDGFMVSARTKEEALSIMDMYIDDSYTMIGYFTDPKDFTSNVVGETPLPPGIIMTSYK